MATVDESNPWCEECGGSGDCPECGDEGGYEDPELCGECSGSLVCPYCGGEGIQ